MPTTPRARFTPEREALLLATLAVTRSVRTAAAAAALSHVAAYRRRATHPGFAGR